MEIELWRKQRAFEHHSPVTTEWINKEKYNKYNQEDTFFQEY